MQYFTIFFINNTTYNSENINLLLARAAITLETERIKGSNPWCLWWWWL